MTIRRLPKLLPKFYELNSFYYDRQKTMISLMECGLSEIFFRQSITRKLKCTCTSTMSKRIFTASQPRMFNSQRPPRGTSCWAGTLLTGKRKPQRPVDLRLPDDLGPSAEHGGTDAGSRRLGFIGINVVFPK